MTLVKTSWRARGLALMALGLGLTLAAAADAAPARVPLPSGAVVGVEADGVQAFKGIPFAAPPIGSLRWRAPQPAPVRTHDLSAVEFGPACPQPPRRVDAAPGGVERFSPASLSEDCLTLNIWTTGKAGSNRPVMVWIPGGAFRVGGASLPYYDGQAFAKQGVVLVTMNYRLGALGFFAHPLIVADAPPGEPVGNYGLMDQIAALEWVKANIAAFGGDPDNITVFGESAGGASVLHLLASPRAKGLFQKAIVESGGGWQPGAPLKAKGAADEAAVRQILDRDPETAEQLRALPADALLALPRGIRFGPMVDGVILPRGVRAAFASGQVIDVPLIIGANSDEATPLMAGFSNDPDTILAELDEDGRRIYSALLDRPLAAAHAVYTDAAFVAPARWIAGKTAGGEPTWLYHFDYVPQARREPGVGASHGAEIPFVFDSWDAIPSAQAFLTEEDSAFAARLNRCWAAFARTGKPDCGLAWPAYDATDDPLLLLADRPSVERGFRKPMLDWQEARTIERAAARRPAGPGTEGF
ncbi:MAG: carboxylesterase family protein [Caulobacteraceae bacterium]|nr:carboxylesterase family protein [Caulobacteraceae bacterium]